MSRPRSSIILDLSPAVQYASDVKSIVSKLSSAQPSTSELKSSLTPITTKFHQDATNSSDSYIRAIGLIARGAQIRDFISIYSAFRASLTTAFQPHFDGFLSAFRTAYSAVPDSARTPEFRKSYVTVLKVRFFEVQLRSIITELNRAAGGKGLNLAIVDTFSEVYTAHIAIQSLQSTFEEHLWGPLKFPLPPSHKHLIQAPPPSAGCSVVEVPISKPAGSAADKRKHSVSHRRKRLERVQSGQREDVKARLQASIADVRTKHDRARKEFEDRKQTAIGELSQIGGFLAGMVDFAFSAGQNFGGKPRGFFSDADYKTTTDALLEEVVRKDREGPVGRETINSIITQLDRALQ